MAKKPSSIHISDSNHQGETLSHTCNTHRTVPLSSMKPFTCFHFHLYRIHFYKAEGQTFVTFSPRLVARIQCFHCTFFRLWPGANPALQEAKGRCIRDQFRSGLSVVSALCDHGPQPHGFPIHHQLLGLSSSSCPLSGMTSFISSSAGPPSLLPSVFLLS